MKKDDNTRTEPQYHEKAVVLHYNDDNKDEIKKQIFYSERPVHVIVDEGVTRIGNDAFRGCNGLTSIKVTENNQIYDSRNDCNAIIETEINMLIRGCKNTKIPEGITSIGNYAFCDCDNLASIEIPGNVTSIGYEVFWGCSSLTSIIWQDKTYGSADEFKKALKAGQ